jgi:hypothetical protein
MADELQNVGCGGGWEKFRTSDLVASLFEGAGTDEGRSRVSETLEKA